MGKKPSLPYPAIRDYKRNRHFFYPLHPNISVHVLHSVFYTLPNQLTRRICLTMKSFLSCLVNFLYSCDLNR